MKLLLIIAVCISFLTGCGSNGMFDESSQAESVYSQAESVSRDNETQAQTKGETESSSVIAESESQLVFESAKEAVANIRIGWNVGNSLDSFGDWINGTGTSVYETAWGNPVITKELIDYIKSLGFNAVRVPVTYLHNIDSEGNINKEWLDRVNEVVDYCIDNDMYCIINVHHDTGASELAWLKADNNIFNEKAQARYVNLWTQIATRFKDYGERLMFEGFNEMLDASDNWGGSTQESYNVINRVNQVFVDTVRNTGGNNLNRNLIVNPYGASSHMSQVEGFCLPSDYTIGHLIVEVHVYSPYRFCNGEDNTFDDGDRQEIEKVFQIINEKLQNKWKVPVIVGEFGVSDKFNSEYFEGELTKYCEAMIENAKQYGIPCILWDNGYDMGFVDRKNLKVTHQKALDAMMRIINQ